MIFGKLRKSAACPLTVGNINYVVCTTMLAGTYIARSVLTTSRATHTKNV